MRHLKNFFAAFSILLFLSIFLNTSAYAARPAITIQPTYKSSTRALRLSTKTKTLGESCLYKIYSSDSFVTIATRTERGNAVLTVPPGQPEIIAVTSSPLPLIRRSNSSRSTKTIYFRAQLLCNGKKYFSTVKSVSLTLARTGGVVLHSWLQSTTAGLKASLENQTVGSYTPTPTSTPTPTLPIPSVKLTQAFPNLSFSSPVEFAPLTDNRIVIVEKGGKIYSFQNDTNTSTKNLILDLSSKIATDGERGTVGVAFHPAYPATPYLYVYYTRSSDGAITLARYAVNTSTTVADINSELVLLSIAHPNNNHNGGKITFGPDGFLYIGVGDGGGGGDPDHNGQNRSVLLGKILRIDVNQAQQSNQYSIPSNNPFRGNSSGFREEIFAYGLRNPWRFSFDSGTGTLWAGDVGQGDREEVDIIESGKNYGWNTMEGFLCYPTNNQNCDKSGLTLPLTDYDHTVGQSITGGYVYRGPSLPGLQGIYVYGDFVTGKIFGLRYTNGVASVTQLVDSTLQISSFGADQQGEVYVLDYGQGKIYKVATQ